MNQKQDLRSLASFRILAGCYLMYDVISRLQHGRFSLLWYTSTNNSFLQAHDTPHQSPVHKIWFYRGSESFQIFLFTVTFLLALSFTLGYKCNVFSKTFLWLNVVAMQCRCMPPHDGSDTFFRHMLLWCIQLPVSEVWSLDQYLHRHISRNYTICNQVAVWGIRLQIVFMYLGTVMNRTVDRYGYSLAIFQSKWLPPQLTAVHYALSGSLATRECWLGNFVRSNLMLSKFMTITSMLTEGVSPLLCLCVGHKTCIPAFSIFMLHFGLLVLMNLPNWQIVGMISCIIWVPSQIWDQLQVKLARRFPYWMAMPPPTSPISLNKKDMLDMNTSKPGVELNKVKERRRKPYLTYFLFIYMVLDFAGNRHWIGKIDNGDIGEFLRFSQYWVMFNGPPLTTSQVMLLGHRADTRDINVWEWIKSGKIQTIDAASFEKDEPWTNFTHVYPSPRVERSLSEWYYSKDRQSRSEHFLKSLCALAPFDGFKMIIQILNIMPPDSGTRYQRLKSDIVTEIMCSKVSQKQ